VNLEDPKEVKGFIAKKNCSAGFKEGLVCCYHLYVQRNGLQWVKPKYRRQDPVIKVPTEERLNRIISSCHLKNVLQFTLIKETGIRPVELHRLSLKDLDLERGLVYIRTAKHGKSRTVKLKPKTLGLLKTYIYKCKDEIVFSSPKTMSRAFQKARNRTAQKLCDPEIKKIRLYDLRHYFGSKLYQKTKDLLYVQRQMGHRSISSTMKYMHLTDFESDEWTCKTAKTIKEAQQLIESGFEYVTSMGDVKLFRKRA
jgi:integrase